MRSALLLLPLALTCTLVAGSSGLAASAPASKKSWTLIAVGDIAACDSTGDEETARLVDSIPGTIATLGDNVYVRGTPEEFAGCYHTSWGRHKLRTRPSPGNHEYLTPGAGGYFDYFGAAAGPGRRGYYSYNLGAWHIVSLNSELETEPGSAQLRWLQADLARSRATCTLAYWHKPRFAAAPHPLHGDVRAFWDALTRARADVVLAGHEHNYQRFAPQTAAGRLDRKRGIRQFIVGTGGRSHERFLEPAPHTEAYDTETFGVLKLILRLTGYSWQFVAEAGKTFRDTGSASCRR